MSNILHYEKDLAIIISVFGSTRNYALKQYYKLVDTIKQELEETAHIELSFSSRIIIKKLEKLGYIYKTLPEQLASIDRMGYKKVLIASINLFPTGEHEYIVKVVESFKNFSKSKYDITVPIFTNATQTNDYLNYLNNTIRTQYSYYNILFIAHGAMNLSISGNQSYIYVRDYLKLLDNKNYFYTIEGTFPYSQKMFLNELKNNNKSEINSSRVILVPLLLIAGNHYDNDIMEIKKELKTKIADVLIPDELFNTDKFSLLELKETTNYFVNQINEAITRLNW